VCVCVCVCVCVVEALCFFACLMSVICDQCDV